MNAVPQHPRRVLALGVAIAIGLLALLPSSWAEAQTGTAGAPPPPVTVVPTTVALTAGSTETTTVGLNPGSTSSISLPPGSIPAGVTQLTVAALPPETLEDNPPPAGNFVAASFTIDLGSETPLDEPATISFELTPEQIAALEEGATPNALFFDTATGTWSEGGSTCTPPSTPVWNPPTLSVEVCHFSDWIVVGQQSDDVAEAPPATAPSPANTGMGADDSGATDPLVIALGAVALAGALGLGGRYAVRRRAA